MSERWDHASLLAAPAPANALVGHAAYGGAAAAACDDEPSAWSDSEPASPLNGWEEAAHLRAFAQMEPTSIRRSGWLLKAAGDGPQRVWRRRFVYLTADRLCYTPDPEAGGPVRYLAVDRVPVRALPRGYGPKLGVALVEDRQVDRSGLLLSPKKAGCVFSVACGSHTHFFAAPSPADAKAWVEAITDVWVRCVKHTARSTHVPSAEEAAAVREARWRADAAATLRRSLAEAEQARLRESTAAWQAAAAAALAEPADDAVACYEIQVVTGSREGAGTTAHVYLELVGAGGSSGEHRLVARDGGRPPFAAGATDAFRLHCHQLGPLLKARVFHNNAGAAPAWFLEEVRVRRAGGADPRWTRFPCARWLAVHQDDGRVMRELAGTHDQALPPVPALQPEPQPAAAAAERVAPLLWYTVAVCTSAEEGAGLAPANGSARVSLALHGARGSSQRVQLPSQPGDFEGGQEDVFRVQLPSVGALEKLTVSLGGAAEQASWLLEQVEVTDEAAGETTYFPCGAWLGRGKGAAERTLLGSHADPRATQREAAHLRQQLDAAKAQLAVAQAELAAARASAAGAKQEGARAEADLAAKLAALQAEVERLQRELEAAQRRAAQAEGQAEQLQAELGAADERAAALRREKDAGQQRAAADGARAAGLESQLRLLQDELAQAKATAATAAGRAQRFEEEARRSEEELKELRAQHERLRRDASARAGDADGELARLRTEQAAKEEHLREARAAEAQAEAACAELERELAAERLRAQEWQEAAAPAAPPPQPEPAASARLQAAYRVSVHTSGEPAGAGTCRPVCLELVGSQGSTGAVRLEGGAAPGGACFAAGAANVFHLEAAAVGELRQLNVWVDMEGAGDVAPGEAAWHLDSVEVAPAGAARPTYFACRRWLDERCGYRAELPPSAHNPRADEAEYRVTVYTSALPGCGTSGSVYVDLQGEGGRGSGVLTLRNRGGCFRPGQADEFTFRLPALGALGELRVGHDGRRDWHLERLEVSQAGGAGAGTTFYFPCSRWVRGSGTGGAPSTHLHLRGYTTDPASLAVQYRLEAQVEGATGALGPHSLLVTLFGPRGDSGVLRLDASRAAPGRTLACVFEAANVGAVDRLRIGLAPADEDDMSGRPRQHCGLLLQRLALTNLASGEAAAFACAEWLRSSDPYDLELDAEGEGGAAAQDCGGAACRYRLEVQTSDVRRGGTRGSVYVTLVGDAGAIGPYQLSNVEGEHFQRGQLDVFEVDGAPDCGRLQQIEVRHDGAGRGGGWHLAWVKASNLTTGAVAMFKCARWVDRREPYDPAVVAVVVSLPPDQAAAAAGGQRSAKDRLLLLGRKAAARAGLGSGGGGGSGLAAATAAAALQAPLVQGVRMEAGLGGSPGHAAVLGSEGGEEGATGLPGYRAVFHTSRMCGSGTRAKVHFELTGSRGSSGVLHPVGTPKSFGAGRCDVFEYPNLPCLGELQSARVGTDGSGLFPGWHLALLVVTHVPTGRVWQFSCYNWIDRRAHYSRWLTLDCVEQKAIYASGAKQASTGLSAAWGLPGLSAVQLSGGGHLAAGLPRQLQYPGSPGSPGGAGGGSTHPLVKSPRRSPLGSPGLGVAHLWGGGLPSPAMRSGSGIPGSPLIGARR